MNKTLKHGLDPLSPQPLARAPKAARKALAARGDDRSGRGESLPPGGDFWKNAIPNPFYKPIKQATTIRVDLDVLLWLKNQGHGYQTRINAILREAMLRSLDGKD